MFVFELDKFLKVSTVKPSRDVIKFTADSRDDFNGGKVSLGFEWLGHNDGAAVEVLHTKCDKIEPKADFKNAELRKVKWERVDMASMRQQTNVIGVVILIELVLLSLSLLHIIDPALFIPVHWIFGYRLA